MPRRREFGAIVVTVVWLDAGVVVEVTLARIALHSWLADDEVIAVVDAAEFPPVVVVLPVEEDEEIPKARKFLITTSSAVAAGSNTSAPPGVMYGPTVGKVTDLSDPGGKLWNSLARFNIRPSVIVWSIVRL